MAVDPRTAKVVNVVELKKGYELPRKNSFRNNVDLNRALARFASPSSGQAVWKEYLRDPIHEPLDFHGMFEEVVEVLVACADADLLRQIRERLDASNDPDEKFRLGNAVTQIEEKLKEAPVPSS